MAGGTTVIVLGRFPLDRRVFVWFDGSASEVVPTSSAQLTVTSPPRSSPGPVDVAVRFTERGRTVDLRLRQAYTYVSPNASATTVPASTTSTTPPSPSTIAAPPSPSTIAAPPSTTTTTVPTWRRGSLTLRQPSAGTLVARVPASWSSAPCTTSPCPLRPLP